MIFSVCLIVIFNSFNSTAPLVGDGNAYSYGYGVILKCHCHSLDNVCLFIFHFHVSILLTSQLCQIMCVLEAKIKGCRLSSHSVFVQRSPKYDGTNKERYLWMKRKIDSCFIQSSTSIVCFFFHFISLALLNWFTLTLFARGGFSTTFRLFFQTVCLFFFFTCRSTCR